MVQTTNQIGEYSLIFTAKETSTRLCIELNTAGAAVQISSAKLELIPDLNYRYAFNGKEKDDEIKGVGNSYDFGNRIYDSRLGRWLSIDPLSGKYPYESPYDFVANSPIFFVDEDGKELTIGGDREKSLADIRSLVPPKYQMAIQVTNEGIIYLDQTKINDENKVWNGNDAGTKLISDLINAKEKYLYENAEEVTVTENKKLNFDYHSIEKSQEKYDMKDDDNGVLNLSTTKRLERKLMLRVAEFSRREAHASCLWA